ncbi:MAG: TolC family protein [Spirochaetaceae bacterium]|jgi:outer membrane protein TolC|nr:TolC family protein [Spirochaetaceae bacterium]
MKTRVFITLVLLAPALFGQEVDFLPSTRHISPSEAVALAVSNNLGLESSRVSITTKKRAMDTRWNVFVPTIDASATLSRANEATAGMSLSPTMSTPETHPWIFSAGLSFSLNFNFASFQGMKSTILDYEGGLISYEKAKAQLERDVRKAYYQMLLLQENIALLHENARSAEQRVQQARANYQAGLEPELTLLQAQVSAENQKPTITQAENGLKSSVAQFAMLLGLPYDTVFEFEPVSTDLSFIPLDLQNLISQAAEGKPDIKELQHQLLTLQQTRKKTAIQLYSPTLSLSWGLTPSIPFADPNINGEWSDSGRFSLTLSFRLNSLFPFDANSQSLKSLDDNIRNLNLNLGQAMRGAEVEVYNTVLSLQEIQTNIEAQSHTLALAQKSYDMTSQAYRSGFSDLLEVQNAELQLRQAQISTLEQRFKYLSGLIDLEYSTGMPFGVLSGL